MALPTLTYEFAHKITSKKYRDKKNFVLLIETVLNCHSSATLIALQQTVQEWLRRAGDHMYYVIFDGEFCCTIPLSWVEISKNLYRLPSECASEKISKFIKKQEPLQDNWSSRQYKRTLGPFKDYLLARKVEQDCVFISTSDNSGPEKCSQQKVSQKRII